MTSYEMVDNKYQQSSECVASSSLRHTLPSTSTNLREPRLRHDFISVLAIAQHLQINFLPITWQPALKPLGAGGTAEIRQSLVNVQTSFAFKRLSRRNGLFLEDSDNIARMCYTEIRVFAHPMMRNHHNVQRLEGLCWDTAADPNDESVLPVMVMEKASYGDSSAFINTALGKGLDLLARLRLCISVGTTLKDMHSCHIIHGDIKPENILIFRDTDDRYIAKVTDFGYSTIVTATDSSQLIYVPKSDPWYAPEHHHRGFSFPHAKKMDIFSFGLFCLWFLFYDPEADSPNRSLLKEQKSANQLPLFVRTLLANMVPPETFSISNLERFFDSALAHLPEERASDLDEILQLLGPKQVRESENKDSLLETYLGPNEFNLSPLIRHLVSMDYRVRSCIVDCLTARSQLVAEDDEWVGSSLMNTLFQLALCYEIGFGVKRNPSAAEAFLFRSTKSSEDMAREMQILRVEVLDQSFYEGLIDTLFSQGDIMEIDYRYQYPTDNCTVYAESEYEIIGFQHNYNINHRTVYAESRYKQEIDDFDSVFGHDHYLSSALRYVLSKVFIGQGRFHDAQELLVHVHSRNVRLLDWSNLYTMNSALVLAFIYRNQGLWEDAAGLELAVVQYATKYYGPKDSTTIDAMNNLAVSYWELRRFDEAEELLEQVIEVKLERRGIEHPNTLNALGNLAAVYATQLRHQDAERLELEVWKMRHKVLGPTHPDTLNSRANLACCFYDQGRVHEASEVEKEILDIRKTAYGSSHPSTLLSMSHYASTLWQLDLHVECQTLEEQVVVSRLETCGTEHPETLKSIANLAATYCNRGYLAESELLFSPALEAMHRVFASEHPHTLDTMDNLASVYTALRRWEDAMRLYTTLVTTREKVLGPHHEDTLQSASHLAYVTQMQQSSPNEQALVIESA